MMIELDDCGRELSLEFSPKREHIHIADVKVIMVIKAPRGTLALFEYAPHRQWQDPTNKYLDHQRMAIKAFMKEHRND